MTIFKSAKTVHLILLWCFGYALRWALSTEKETIVARNRPSESSLGIVPRFHSYRAIKSKHLLGHLKRCTLYEPWFFSKLYNMYIYLILQFLIKKLKREAYFAIVRKIFCLKYSIYRSKPYILKLPTRHQLLFQHL